MQTSQHRHFFDSYLLQWRQLIFWLCVQPLPSFAYVHLHGSVASCFPVVTHSINGLTEVLESTTIKTEVLESTTLKTVEEKVRVINAR